MGRPVDVGLRIGMGLTIVTAGVVAGAPISGAIFDHTGSYKNVGYYGGKPSSYYSRSTWVEGYVSESRFDAGIVGRPYGRDKALLWSGRRVSAALRRTRKIVVPRTCTPVYCRHPNLDS